MATRRKNPDSASVFPAEAFKLFRQMADSLKRLEGTKEELVSLNAKVADNTKQIVVLHTKFDVLSAKVDTLASDLTAGLNRAEIRREAGDGNLREKVRSLETP